MLTIHVVKIILLLTQLPKFSKIIVSDSIILYVLLVTQLIASNNCVNCVKDLHISATCIILLHDQQKEQINRVWNQVTCSMEVEEEEVQSLMREFFDKNNRKRKWLCKS